MNKLRKVFENYWAKKALENYAKSKKVITLEVVDQDNKLENLLAYIRNIGNVGHSFNILVDPDNSDTKKNFGWDGDGSDRIFEITVNGVPLEKN